MDVVVTVELVQEFRKWLGVERIKVFAVSADNKTEVRAITWWSRDV